MQIEFGRALGWQYLLRNETDEEGLEADDNPTGIEDEDRSDETDEDTEVRGWGDVSELEDEATADDDADDDDDELDDEVEWAPIRGRAEDSAWMKMQHYKILWIVHSKSEQNRESKPCVENERSNKKWQEQPEQSKTVSKSGSVPSSATDRKPIFEALIATTYSNSSDTCTLAEKCTKMQLL